MKLLFLRRVVGHSMVPEFSPGRVVVASGLKKPVVGSVVIANWRGKDIVKRISSIKYGRFNLSGDNKADSLDIEVAKADIHGVII